MEDQVMTIDELQHDADGTSLRVDAGQPIK
jgi:hypothetical protein